MDRKVKFSLLAAKYSAYIFTLWAIMIYSDAPLGATVITFFLIFSVDNIRLFYLEAKNPHGAQLSLYLQSFLIFIFVITDEGYLGNVLYVILIVESLIFYPRSLGDRIFLTAVMGYLGGSTLSLFLQNNVSWNSFIAVIANSVFILLVYAISYLARRHSEEKERAEEALQELKKSRNELEKAHIQLLEHSKQREKMMLTEERNRLAREIHDTLGHTLTTVIIGIEAGKKLLQKDPERSLFELEKSQEQARKGLDEIRRSVKALLPRKLEESGFLSALKGLALDFNNSGVTIEFQIHEELTVPPEYELPLFRVIQESVTNSIRHGKASMVTVSIEKNDTKTILRIADNGKGCDTLQEGYGLKGIRERLENINGTVDFKTTANGFMVVAQLNSEPIPKPEVG